MQKIAIVTGASYGLGEEMSHRLIEMGYKVYGVSRSKPKSPNKNLIWIQADLAKDIDIDKIPALVSEETIDILINNAGTDFPQKALQYTDADFDRMFTLNFKAYAKLAKLLFSKLSGGLLLNISSLSDRYPDQEFGLYCASKAAVNIFFETMAAEEPSVKIVNILPSYVDTPLQHVLREGRDFDWDWCMKASDVADCIKQVIDVGEQIETGTRVIIEKNENENTPYNPEKLWVYAAQTKKMCKVR